MTIIDIETAPLSLAELEAMMPEPDIDKRLKDPEKIKAAIEADRAKFIERAALSAETGRILAIGIKYESGVIIKGNETCDDDGETKILTEFWKISLNQICMPFVGHNVINFDFPFMARRSWKLGIRPNIFWRGKPWEMSDRFIDTMEVYACGEYGRRISLNNLAKFFGLPEKTGEGTQFAEWWTTDRPRAIEYLTRDLELAEAVARKMGAIS